VFAEYRGNYMSAPVDRRQTGTLAGLEAEIEADESDEEDNSGAEE
jgi:hypothetical protein